MDGKLLAIFSKDSSYELSDIDQSLVLNYIPRWPLFVFLASAIFCLGASAIFHLFFIHSQKTCEILSRLDYSGISILICGSSMSPIMYAFACKEEHSARDFFLGLITVSCTLCTVFSLHPIFATPKFRSIRAGMYIVLGVSAVCPLAYISFLE
jgi:adiponectin receptor